MTVNDQAPLRYADPSEDGQGDEFLLRAIAVNLADEGFAVGDVRTWGAGGSTAHIWVKVAGQMAEAAAGGFDVAAFREQMIAEDKRLCAEERAR